MKTTPIQQSQNHPGIAKKMINVGKFACLGATAIGLALASDVIVGAALNSEMRNAYSLHIGTEQFFEFSKMFKNVFTEANKNELLVTSVAAMQVIGVAVIGKNILSSVKNMFFSTAEQKKEKAFQKKQILEATMDKEFGKAPQPVDPFKAITNPNFVSVSPQKQSQPKVEQKSEKSLAKRKALEEAMDREFSDPKLSSQKGQPNKVSVTKKTQEPVVKVASPEDALSNLIQLRKQRDAEASSKLKP